MATHRIVALQTLVRFQEGRVLGSWCNGSIWDCASQGRGSIPRLPLDDDKMNGNRRRRWSAPLGVMATHRIVAPQTSVRFREGRVIPHWRNGSAEVCRTSRGGSIPPCGSAVWSSVQDSWFSISRLGFNSRYRNFRGCSSNGRALA